KADSPRFVDDGRAHAEDGRGGSERWSGRNPRSSVTAMATITAPLSSRVAAADRNLEAWVPGRRDGTSELLLCTSDGRESVRRQRFGVVPPLLGTVGDERSFLAWGPRHQAPTCRPIRVLVARARSESSKGPRP